MSANWSRRDALRALGLVTASLPPSSWAVNEKGEKIILPGNPLPQKKAGNGKSEIDINV